MARVKNSVTTKARHKKVLKAAKGYFGSKHRLYKTAKEQLMHSGMYAYRDRRQKKRDFRSLWITRINAACRENNISYSKFIDGLNKAGVEVNRKMLSEIAIENPKAFAALVKTANDGLNGKAVAAAKTTSKETVTIVKAGKKATKEEVKEEVKEKVAAKKAEVKEKVAEKKAEVKEKVAEAKETAKKSVEKAKATAKASVEKSKETAKKSVEKSKATAKAATKSATTKKTTKKEEK